MFLIGAISNQKVRDINVGWVMWANPHSDTKLRYLLAQAHINMGLGQHDTNSQGHARPR